MRRVILQEFVTFDGLAAGPNDNVGSREMKLLEAKSFDRGAALLKYTERARSA